MKNNFLVICFLLCIMSVCAQKRGNTWYFGQAIGLDFNQTPPRTLHNGILTCIEGSATISDNNGNLLFYTDGVTVVNRKHQQMLNGNFLTGHLSSTNNAFIIPLPGNDSLYYIFTTGAAKEEFHQFSYSVVNIKGDGGFGEVVQKNILIEDIIFEKLGAVRHCNNTDVWLTVRKWNSDEYHCYLLTRAGFNPVPVVSNTGLVVGGVFENNAIGTLKFSFNGKKLAAAHSFQNDIVELMDFDNATGILSNPVTFRPNNTLPQSTFTGVYGAEFSPNGNLLYVSSNTTAVNPCTLYQFDITGGTAAAILASKQIIGETSPWYAGSLQIGPDKKIYMAMWKDSALSVIDKPDIYGPGCDFRFNEIRFGGETVQFGLPSFITTDFNVNLIPYDFTRSAGDCRDLNITFAINRTTGIDSVKWDFGDTQQSQLLSPSHTYAGPGTYTVSLIVYSVNCSGLSRDTIKHDIWIANNFTLLGNDTSACIIKDIKLGVGITGVNYLWNTGGTTDSITVNSPGEYWIRIEKFGCLAADTLNVFQDPAPVVNAGKDTTVCGNQAVVLYAGNSTASNYLWNTGETTQSITVRAIGEYSVTVTENSCQAADTVSVGWGDCEVYIPSGFTPNGDGRNDYFGVLNGFAGTNFFLQIFDKRGLAIFSTESISQKWDGTYKKAKQPMGAYIWTMQYMNTKKERKFLYGTVMLIR